MYYTSNGNFINTIENYNCSDSKLYEYVFNIKNMEKNVIPNDILLKNYESQLNKLEKENLKDCLKNKSLINNSKDNISNEYITIINPVNKEDKFKLRFKTIFDKGATKIIPSTSKISKDTIFEIKDGIYDKFTFKNIKENNDRYCYLLNNKINNKKKKFK